MLGAYQLTGPNSNSAGAGATFTVANRAVLSFGAANVFPDTAPISLPAAVTAYPGAGARAGWAIDTAARYTLIS
jgi:hypothetical protein